MRGGGLDLPGVRRTTPSRQLVFYEMVVILSDASGVWVGPEGTAREHAERVDFFDQPAPIAGAVCVVARGALGLHLLTGQRTTYPPATHVH